ncbi:histidinol-phosphate transaminase [Aureimonas sp. ME7]|uniref:pyridoxal phosphate-dependent aminotransferase n=1 Tax=Aureimonas sp. ME7 TaxID=2744252 RepID=UPI0015F681FA|nr:histidinol-phosphate transaminase [Aureimonas sp. ME7]
MAPTRDLLDFCVPVNPYFPPPELLDEIRDALPDLVKYYPDYAETHQAHLAEWTGMPSANIVAANGSTELITLLCRNAAAPFVTPIPTFGRWTDLPRENGLSVSFLERRREAGFTLNVAEIIDQVIMTGARTLVVCNPDNPTGTVLSAPEIETLVRSLPDLDLIVVDESFIDFSDVESAAALALRSRNLVVVKSLGKALGWHGVRLGYAVANERLAAELRAQVPFWNINGLAAFVLRRVLAHAPAFRASLGRVKRDRHNMIGRLMRIDGLRVFPSAANFVFCELPDGVSGQWVRDALLQDHGLFVRECGNKLGSSDRYLRLAVHPPKAVDALCEGLREVLERASPA